jgi:hypothetical protein
MSDSDWRINSEILRLEWHQILKTAASTRSSIPSPRACMPRGQATREVGAIPPWWYRTDAPRSSPVGPLAAEGTRPPIPCGRRYRSGGTSLPCHTDNGSLPRARLPLSSLRGCAAAHEHFDTGSYVVLCTNRHEPDLLPLAASSSNTLAITVFGRHRRCHRASRSVRRMSNSCRLARA